MFLFLARVFTLSPATLLWRLIGAGFKLYYNHTELMAGRHFNSFLAPLSVGQHTGLEGTPNVYSAELVLRDGYYMVDAQVGFHFNDASRSQYESGLCV